MKKVTILCPSSLSKDILTYNLAQSYIKKIKSIVEINELNTKIQSSDTPITVKQKQSDQLLNYLHKKPAHSYVIALDEKGKKMDSPSFAKHLSSITVNGYSSVYIIIGGAHGLSDDIIQQSDFRLSLGDMVWPHRLVFPMVLEQIYRAQQINTGHPYHKN